VISVVYISSATHLFSDRELLDLLAQAREKNARLDITGMLLYKDGNFMQVLEGPEETVRNLYTTIRADARHHGLLKLMESSVTARTFSEWAMAFHNLDDVSLAEVPGYSQFLNDPLNSPAFKQDPTRAQKLLLTFRRNM